MAKKMAKKFKFQLESFLTIKKFNVSRAENALFEVLAIKYAKENEVRQMYEEITLLNTQKGKLAIIDLQARFHRKIFLEQRIEQIKAEIVKIEEIEQIKRKELAFAMKEEKVLEKLKEKKKVAHKIQIDKEEDQNLDEIAIKQFLKQIQVEN